MHSKWTSDINQEFCKVETLVDNDGNVFIDHHGNLKIKVPNPIVELPYTYLVAWYIMHYPSLMTAAYTSELHAISSEDGALVLATYLYILH